MCVGTYSVMIKAPVVLIRGETEYWSDCLEKTGRPELGDPYSFFLICHSFFGLVVDASLHDYFSCSNSVRAFLIYFQVEVQHMS